MAEEIIYDFVHEIIKNNKSCSRYKITDITRIINNKVKFTAIIFGVTLTKDDDNICLFLKLTVPDGETRYLAEKFYKTESFVYTTLFKEYEKLQEEHHVPEEQWYNFLKCYGCKGELRREIVALENLLYIGYKPARSDYDWQFTKTVASELAKLHALSFSYSVYYPEEFNKIVNDYKFKPVQSDEKICEINDGIMSALSVTNNEYKDKLRRLFQPIDMELFEQLYKWSKNPVLVHGQVLSQNIMQKIREDKSLDVRLVDFQHLLASSPLVDLFYLIYTGCTDHDFREKYFDKLMEHYYTELEDAMKILHVNPDELYSKTDFYNELEEKRMLGLIIAMFHVPQNTDDMPEICHEMGIAYHYLRGRKFYADRFNGILKDYEQLGLLK